MTDGVLTVNTLLTLLTIGSAGVVVLVWMPTFVLNAKKNEKLEPHQLLLLGIAISFLSTICDNIYWGITWFAKLKQWPTAIWWLDHGPIANTFFRHLGKIMAAGCHIEAARRSGVVLREEITAMTVLVCVVCLFIFCLLFA